MRVQHLLRGAALLTMAAASFVVPGRVARAAFPGTNGKIAFMSGRDGNDEIYVMSATGTSQTRLTNNLATDAGPSWSADGTKIVYMEVVAGAYDVFVMNADGSAQTNVSNHTGSDYNPSWSPDGTKITFQSFRDGNSEIYVMNADGSNQTRLTNNAGDDEGPAWSPDGTKIAWDTDRNGTYEIYVMNANGSAQTRLTNNAVDDLFPDWAPDGTKLAFYSALQVATMSSSGGAITTLTSLGTNVYPSWSPDGTKITFVSTRDGDGQGEIYVMGSNGSSQTRLTNDPSFPDSNPDWQPVAGGGGSGVTSVTVSTSGTRLSGNKVRTTGTITCTSGNTWKLKVTVKQGTTASASGSKNGTCTSASQAWTVDAAPQSGSGAFTAGQAQICATGKAYLGSTLVNSKKKCVTATLT
jgi:TolB protein